MMKRLLLLLGGVLLGCVLRAEVLFVENFETVVGTAVEGYNGWFTHYDGASGMTISTGLEFPNYQMSGIGGAALLDGDCGTYQPHHSFAAVTADTLYVAFLFQPTVVGKKGYFFSLRDTYSNSTFNYIGRVSVSEDSYLGLRFYKTAAEVYDETMPLEQNKVYLIVLKYKIVPGNNNDEISLYAFDRMPTEEPEQPLIGPIKDANAPDIQPENIILRSFDANSWLMVDGIRVATTWKEAAAYVASTALPSAGNAIDAPRYNLLGQQVGDDYKGIVVENGQKRVVR